MPSLIGLAFSEVPEPRMPSGVPPYKQDHAYGPGVVPWYGPGVYNTMATPYVDPRALADMQKRDAIPVWNGSGETAQHWLLSYTRWEQNTGVALGDHRLTQAILGSIPKYRPFQNLLNHPLTATSQMRMKQSVTSAKEAVSV